MAKDFFPQDILDDALDNRQQKRREKRAQLRRKKEQQELNNRLRQESRAKRRKVFFVGIAVLVMLFIFFGKSVFQIIKLSKERDAAEARLEELQYKIDQLNDELARVTSPEYIEQQARSQLRMIYPGELLYVVTNDKMVEEPSEETTGGAVEKK